MSTPPSQPGDGKPKKAKKPLDKQLDELLIGIEEVEPGTIDPKMLPGSFKAAECPTNAEIQAMLNEPPAEAAAQPQAESAPTPEAQADTATPEQADMLAALNSALQGLTDEQPADESSDAPAAPADTPPAEELSMEDKLQQDIASLMNAEPVVEASATPEDLAATEAVQGSTSSVEDQIAMEIEGLLNTGPAEPAADNTADSTADNQAIDELDKMLAQEIDADDELAGDFHSVEAITAGIQVPDSATSGADDEHAATARDVAAELDNQPEDLPEATFEPVAAAESSEEDPFAVLAQIADTAEQNEQEHQRRIAMQTPDWQRWLEIGKERLLNTCYAINWPARRFLSTEWRSILGIIALMNLCTGLGFWIILILF